MDGEDVRKEERPWGRFKVFAFNEKCTVKILEVNQGEELSLQKHENRDELWYFLTEGIVQLGEDRIVMEPGKEIKINHGVPHRIIAESNNVIVLEVSFGEFDEKDEVRIEDKYGRE